MSISIDCQCGKSIDYDEDESLDNEEYTPHEIVCNCCGAVFNLCIHLEFVKDGDPNKKFPEDDPEFCDLEEEKEAVACYDCKHLIEKNGLDWCSARDTSVDPYVKEPCSAFKEG